MTSCPSEEDLVLFVEGTGWDAPEPGSEAVADHLTACAACRALVARSEAALRYALGGVADRSRVAGGADVRRARSTASTRRSVAPWLAAAAAVVAAIAGTWGILRSPGVGGDVGVRGATVAHAPSIGGRAADAAAQVDELLARADRLAAAARPEPASDAALAALAAADARLGLGMPTAAARYEDVIDRFPGTPEAREARARLAQIGGGR